jgi:hypothetical protein
MYDAGHIAHKLLIVEYCFERVSGLQTLLETTPPLPGRKLSWYNAVEDLRYTLDGQDWRLTSAAELRTRMVGLKSLENHMIDLGLSVAAAVSEGVVLTNRNTQPSPSGKLRS